MRIERLRVRQFGCFRDYEIRFQRGLNVIKGPNEAGKSTLHRGIMMALLDRPNQSKSNERYRAWGAGEWYALEIEFYNDDSGPYLLSKDFNSRTQELVAPDGNSIKTLDRLQPFLDSALGTSSPTIFESTVCVVQDELASLAKGQKEISRSLEGIVTGGNENSYAPDAIKKLNDKIVEYNRGVLRHAPTNPGPIARISAERLVLVERVRAYEQKLSEREKDEKDLIETKENLDNVEPMLASKRAMKEMADKTRGLEKQLEALVDKERSLDSTIKLVVGTNNEITQATKTLSDVQAASRLSEQDLHEIRELQTEIKRLSVELNPPVSSYALPIVILMIGLIFVGVALYFVGNPVLLIVLIVASMLSMGLGVYLIMGVKRNQNKKHLVVNRESTNPYVLPNGSLEELQSKLAERLARAGFSTVEEMERTSERESNARQALETAQQRMGILLQGKSAEDLENERKKASADVRRLQEQLEEPNYQRAANISLEQYQNLENELLDLERKQQALKEGQQRIAGRLEQAAVSQEDLLQAKERLSILDAELLSAEERLKIYQLASKVMQEARESTLTRASDEIAPRLGGYLRSLTLGKYDCVTVDSELNIRVKHPTLPTLLIEPQDLSRGAQDQLYLAARLALVDLLFREAKPPIFLDDPFVKYDPSRLRSAISLCQAIAKERQVLLFTCSNHYDYAGHVIALNSSTSQRL